jgi:DNA-binding transcriptional LysR family regulator
VVVAPRGWQARLHGLGWAELAALPWIVTPPDSVHHRLLAPLMARLGQRLHTVARVDQEASMIDLVRAGFGLSLAREAVALREADGAGLAVWRQQPLDTALSLLALESPPADPARARTVAQLFDAAASIWPGG